MGGWGNMMGGWGNGSYGYGGYGWMGIMGIIMPILFIVVIILLGIYLFRRNTSPHTFGLRGHNSPLDILRERYARGEIDSAEYEKRKQDLEGK